MNILLFEWKNEWKSLLYWIIIIELTFISLSLGAYPIFRDSMIDIVEMINKMPPEFVKAFAFDMNSMFDFGGFYQFIFAYISLIGAIMATSFGISIFAREKRARCNDFLLTKPRSRKLIFLNKTFVGLACLVISNIVFISTSCIIGTHFGKSLNEMLPASCMLFLTQLLFYGAGILFAILAKRVRTISGPATLLGFIGFILSALYNNLEIESLKYLAPLKYFDPMQFFIPSTMNMSVMIVGISLIVILAVTSYIYYINKDTKAI